MQKLLFLVASLLVVAPPDDKKNDPYARMKEQSRDCLFVVVGRVIKVISHTNIWPETGTLSTAVIEVRRHLKGNSDVKTLEAEFRFESSLEMKPDEGDVIWFVRKRPEDGRYLVTDWKWGLDSLPLIQASVNRADKRTRIPNMPKAVPGATPIVLSLGAGDGKGGALASVKAPSLSEVEFLVQLENRSEGVLSVMPCLYGSEIRRRYPHYDLEVRDLDGKQVESQGVGICGNIVALSSLDIVSLRPGEVLRTTVPSSGYEPPLGRYRVRVRYTARRDITGDGIQLGSDDPRVPTLIKTVWEGELQSNWIEVEITNGGLR